MNKDKAIDILANCSYCPIIVTKILIERCLVTVDRQSNKLEMCGLLQLGIFYSKNLHKIFADLAGYGLKATWIMCRQKLM